MSDTASPTTRELTDDGTSVPATPSLGFLLAGLMAAAGTVHLAMVPAHVGDSLLDPVAFAVVGWFQLGVAALLVARRPSKGLYLATMIGNAVVLGLWIWSRTAGLPWGGHAGVVEEAGAVDVVTAGFELAAIFTAGVLLAGGERIRVPMAVPAVGGLAALSLATVVLVSPDTAEHAHGSGDGELASSGGHDHGGNGDAMTAEMTLVDQTRCDLGFNPVGYWEEATFLGVDTYGGGTMTHDDHDGTSVLGAVSATMPKGSATLDDLISLTEGANESEGAAAGLVTSLSEASDAEYTTWLQWLKASGSVGHGHGHDPASGDDNGGHGGHVGPQPWKAMIDQGQCDQLADELALARETALTYPTAKDAVEAGWVMVTPYVPGIAAHYMNFSLVDGEFVVDEPEMILYDGNSPDSAVVGLSYYLVHDAEAEPTQGFTGDNDHYHRHVGLCTRGGVVVGDSSVTAEECEAMGGRKASGNNGWMSHAWVVPGCESPWGVFSAASPILDRTLVDNSTTDGGACAGSGVIDRWDLTPGTRDTTPKAASSSDADATESAQAE